MPQKAVGERGHSELWHRKPAFSGPLSGSVGWASDSWLWLRSWSHGSGDWAPCRALCWQCGACLGFSLSISLFAPTPTFLKKKTNKKQKKKPKLKTCILTILLIRCSEHVCRMWVKELFIWNCFLNCIKKNGRISNTSKDDLAIQNWKKIAGNRLFTNKLCGLKVNHAEVRNFLSFTGLIRVLQRNRT